jgi:dipeptidyl aminopeptidase/acylaminoacyl peptidase
MQRLATAVLALVAGAPLVAQQPAPDAATADYRRAERMLAAHASKLAYHERVAPRWMRGGDRFWYSINTPDGTQFILVDPAAGVQRPLLDNARLAAAMSVAGDTAFDPKKLPMREFRFADDGRDERTIEFNAAKRGYRCDIAQYRCTAGDSLPSRARFVTSPDGKLEAFVSGHDLWVRPSAGGDSTRLTTDGAEYWAYGSQAARPQQLLRKLPPGRPVLQWSPDSRKIAVERWDEREVQKLCLYSSTTQRPRAFCYPYAMPGDSIVARYDIHILDVASKSNVRVQAEPQPYFYGSTGMMDSTWVAMKWGSGSDRLWFTHGSRAGLKLALMEADAATGATRTILRDSSATYIEMNLDLFGKPDWAVLKNGQQFVWFSERDGWGHLYRFDRDGKLVNRITEGPWTVGSIVSIDEATGRVVFTARGREPGRNPAFADLYAVNLDGSGLVRLGGEAGNHDIAMSPSERYLVDVISAPETAPVSVLRDRTGRVVKTLEKADLSALGAAGWRAPMQFTTKARDGITDLHGLMFLPSTFDSTKSYPIIENIYPGPFIGSVGSWSFSLGSGRADQQALAELGFVVIQLDAMGTPFRSKAFQDNYHGFMGDNGLPDHVAALKQLAARHPWIDLSRAGIYGHSGGGFASTDAILRYPDVYKVAVSSSGNHDNRTYNVMFGEKYMGLMVRDTLRKSDNYAASANKYLAKNLQGHLLLITGDMDDNVHPSMTIQVVDELIKANRNFDLLVMPDRGHGLDEPYVIRRRWDYFVHWLRGETPPNDYQITLPTQ